MDFSVKFKLSEKIYLKDPESTDLGKEIVSKAVDLIYDLGFEAFTFKKLAIEINTTEASIYRYFENKHRLLLYIFNLYWSYLEYIVTYELNMKLSPKSKIEAFIDLITNEVPDLGGEIKFDGKKLNEIVIAEGSKVFLVKEVNEINKGHVFKPYKDLCNTIAEIIKDYNPKYSYPHSLSSTIVETAHAQQFFLEHLPKLTDIHSINKKMYTTKYLKDLVFKVLND
jgi:AcrR family transcriptional regulator